MNNKLSNFTVIFEKNSLNICNENGKKIINFQSPIEQIEQFDEIIVVMVYPKTNNFLNENLYGVSYDGKILWQVEKIEHVDRDSPYTGMGEENGLLGAYNWDGFDYLIDPKTGKILDKKFVK